jgi:hypothetical protein
MAALYLYAITDQPAAPLPPAAGLEESPLCPLACQDLVGVVSSLTTTQVQATESNLWRHEAVIEALMADRAVLPVRFGTVFSNEAAARAELMAQRADLACALNRVRGRVELGLRVIWISPDEPQTTNDERKVRASSPGMSTGRGRAYLMARLEEERRARAERQQAEALAAEIHTPLAQLAAESVQQVLVTPRLLLTAAYLVERSQVEAFRHEVGVLSAAHPALSLLCTGPWPAYSFVDLRTHEEPGG